MSLNKIYQLELRQHYMFRRLSEAEFGQVVAKSKVLKLSRNESLFKEGDIAKNFFIVRKGTITLYMTSLEGNEKIIDIIGPGQTFAEAVMFMDSSRYPVNAKAATMTQIFLFDNDLFMQLLRKSNYLCFTMMADMSMRLRGLISEISELTIYNAKYRLVNYLLSHINDQQPNPSIKLTSTKSMIASRLSITPETFSRILSNLKKEGLILIEDETITLIEPDKLKSIIGKIK